MTSNQPALFTLVLAFLLFDIGLGSQTEAPAGHFYAGYGSGTCESTSGGQCQTITSQSQCEEASRADWGKQTAFNAAYNWHNSYPKGCFFQGASFLFNTAGSSYQPCSNGNQCACLCSYPTRAPTPAPTTSTPTSTPTTLSPTSTPTTLAPTLTECQTLKGEIKDKCGPESPVNKVIQKAQDAVDTSPQDPMVDLGEYKLSDLEKEQKEGTCGFAKSDPAYLATELVLKINKLSTLV